MHGNADSAPSRLFRQCACQERPIHESLAYSEVEAVARDHHWARSLAKARSRFLSGLIPKWSLTSWMSQSVMSAVEARSCKRCMSGLMRQSYSSCASGAALTPIGSHARRRVRSSATSARVRSRFSGLPGSHASSGRQVWDTTPCCCIAGPRAGNVGYGRARTSRERSVSFTIAIPTGAPTAGVGGHLYEGQAGGNRGYAGSDIYELKIRRIALGSGLVESQATISCAVAAGVFRTASTTKSYGRLHA